MKELAEGGLPSSGSEVVVWYNEEEHQVIIQYDNFDINLYASDFLSLMYILKSAEMDLAAEIGEDG
jgi:hypothetical protein